MAAMKNHEPPKTRKEPRLPDWRDEMNLAEFPITLLTDRAPDGQNTLEFKDTITDQSTGEPVTRIFTLSSPDRYGLPTPKDAEVILALIHLTKVRNDFTERTVNFSRYELMNLLGWPNYGETYKRLEESLTRWTAVFLDYKKAWWDNDRQSWVNEKFHIIDQVTLYELG
jgi:hypothetical protein